MLLHTIEVYFIFLLLIGSGLWIYQALTFFGMKKLERGLLNKIHQRIDLIIDADCRAVFLTRVTEAIQSDDMDWFIKTVKEIDSYIINQEEVNGTQAE